LSEKSNQTSASSVTLPNETSTISGGDWLQAQPLKVRDEAIDYPFRLGRVLNAPVGNVCRPRAARRSLAASRWRWNCPWSVESADHTVDEWSNVWLDSSLRRDGE
jgi:hypothetical protein